MKRRGHEAPCPKVIHEVPMKSLHTSPIGHKIRRHNFIECKAVVELVPEATWHDDALASSHQPIVPALIPLPLYMGGTNSGNRFILSCRGMTASRIAYFVTFATCLKKELSPSQQIWQKNVILSQEWEFSFIIFYSYPANCVRGTLSSGCTSLQYLAGGE